MREILFRGKRIDNGNWVIGSLFTSINDCYIIPLPIVTSKAKVDPQTVGQYTGLTDKNGNRIFEGDILKDKWGRIEMCIYMESRRRIMFSGSNYSREMENADESEYEVIGNIHDNPELLKGDAT